MKYIEDDVVLDSDFTRKSMSSLNKIKDMRNRQMMTQLTRHGHAKSMIEKIQNISRKRSNVNFSQLLQKANRNKELAIDAGKDQETDQ